MIVFLDFDGVLHPDEVYLQRRNAAKPVLRAEGSLFMWAPHLVEILADAPEVRLALSTSWVRELRFARARDALPAALRPKVIGATWHSGMATDDQLKPLGRETWWDLATRYEQIARFVRAARIEKWVAIDDRPEGWPAAMRDRLVQTDSHVGLSAPAARVRLAAAVGNLPYARATANAMADALGEHQLPRDASPTDLMRWSEGRMDVVLDTAPRGPRSPAGPPPRKP